MVWYFLNAPLFLFPLGFTGETLINLVLLLKSNVLNELTFTIGIFRGNKVLSAFSISGKNKFLQFYKNSRGLETFFNESFFL